MSRRRRSQSNRRRTRPPHLRPVPEPLGPSRLSRALTVDSYAARALATRADRFGGVEIHESIDTEPIPDDEPFDWSVVQPVDCERVGAVLAALDTATSDMLFARRPEYVTIMRRLLARAAQRPAGTIRRRTSPERIAAGLGWIALGVNGEVGRRRGQFSAGLIWHVFGVGDCGSLARAMAESLDMLESQPEAPPRRRHLTRTGDLGLLRGYVRAYEIDLRDRLLDQVDADLARQAENAVVQITPDGISLRAREADFAMCIAVEGDAGEPLVAIALGADPVEPDEAFSLSVADAASLLDSLERAIGTHQRRTS